MSSPNAILHELLNLAEIMLTNGAEVSRVEETLNRMGHAYGASQMNVFAITSSIVVTMVFPEGEEYTQTRRITTPAGTDFFKLEQANALSRQCCATPLSLTDLKDEINNKEISPLTTTQTITVQKQDGKWKVMADENLRNAIFPGLSEAVNGYAE